MVMFIDNTKDSLFKDVMRRLPSLSCVGNKVVSDSVSNIIHGIRTRGDEALLEYTKQFDNFDAGSVSKIVLSEYDMRNAKSQVDAELREAITLAATRIRKYQQDIMPCSSDKVCFDNDGISAGWRWSPVDRAGIYVPGGKAVYPSSVLMTAIPAIVAGVRDVVMCTPALGGVCNPVLLFAASVAGVNTIYCVGGSQAIAAMAIGTDTVRKVDKIAGPGNAYVSEAKRQLYGEVGIDMIAGPTEIMVLADSTSNPEWAAIDLLSQAEHDEMARVILVTDSRDVGNKIAEYVERYINSGTKRSDIIRKSWDTYGTIVVVDDMVTQGVAIVNMIAPEHLSISTADPESLLPLIRNAGAIFLGQDTPQAIGDYIAGPDHVLPTSGSARFSSALSCMDFMKHSSIIRCNRGQFSGIGEKASLIAIEEDFPAHALSINMRM